MVSQGSSERYRQIEAIFQRAADLPRPQRAALLDDACENDPEMRAEVEALLLHLGAAPPGYLEAPPHALAQCSAAGVCPQRIGAYAIVRLLGRGGMGAVYEAEPARPRRRVALKVIRSDAVSDDAVRRFRHEAEVLGHLRHPGIAQLYEFGTGEVWFNNVPTPAQPYFAMELVAGQSLAAYVAQRDLPLRDTLDLLARVCDAVHHAHQKGVIHRDLKPSNILVDEAGQPKVLDFGVARVTGESAWTVSAHTRAGQLLGTIPYMSPEQLGGSAHAADTRSDVYALGVVAYELLTGGLPFDVANLPVAQAIRVLAEQDARPAGARRSELRGDVEAILARALERRTDDRYGTAAELAADIRRHLRHEPIMARPATALYQLRKLARRRRGLVVSGALVLLAVGTGVGVAGWQALRAAQANRIAAAVNDFLNQDLLGQANPYREPDRDILLREVLDRAARKIEGRLADAPLAEAAVRQTLGVTYRSLGALDVAQVHLARALELVRARRGDDDRATIRLLIELGDTYRIALRLDEAEQHLQSAIARASRRFGPEDPDTLEARSDLALVAIKRGRMAEAEAAIREVLAVRRRVLGSEHGATLISMNTLALTLQHQGRFEESAALFEECVARSRRVLGPEHPDTMTAIANLGLFYTRLDRFAEAEPLCLEALDLRRRVLGEEHRQTLEALNNVGYFYSLQRRFAECEPYYRQVYETRRRALGPEHADTLLSMNNLGWLAMQLQRWDEAEELLTEMLETTGRVAPDSLDLALSRHTLGGFYVKRGQYETAERLLHAALAGLREKLPDGDWRIGGSLSAYGDCLRRLGRFVEAEPYLREGYARQHAALGADHQQTRRAAEALAELYTDWDRPEQASRWRAELAAQR